MNRHYQEIVDEVFGTRYKHRTLRTLFDQDAHEWSETTIEEKKDILNKILGSNKISFQQVITGYTNFYLFELENKGNAVNSLSKSIEILGYTHLPEVKTIRDFDIEHSDFKIENLLNEFAYQQTLTKKLDELSKDHNIDFDQEIINQIVLWKVNRFAEFDEEVLNQLNKINYYSNEFDNKLTKSILTLLLDRKGVGLPMASTILRFKNPRLYQIIDQRVFRVIYGEILNLPHNLNSQIDLYLKYLTDLRKVCNTNHIKFEDSDRILFELDKKLNKQVSLNGY